MRKWHYLKPNMRSELPKFCVFVDTESKATVDERGVQHHTLEFGFAELFRINRTSPLDSRLVSECVFETYIEFWEWVLANSTIGTCFYIFAHNWQFDAAMLQVEQLTQNYGFTARKVIIDTNRFIVDLRRNKFSIKLRDSMNYFSVSLAVLGKSIGVEKMELPDATATRETKLEYCRNDVRILRQAMLIFMNVIREHNLGNFQPTIASQAMTSFRHRFMKHKILIHGDERALAMERRAYFGGRVECFFLGEKHEDMYQLDVNSMYPFVMQYSMFPIKPRFTFERPAPGLLGKLLEQGCCVADVVLETDEPAYPVRHKDRLVFPVGRFKTTLSSP